MSTFVLVHGAWHGGWCWADVADHLRAAGHVVVAPTLLGSAERAGELHPDVGLSDHAEEIALVLDPAQGAAGRRRGGRPQLRGARRPRGDRPDRRRSREDRPARRVGRHGRRQPALARTFQQRTRLTGAIDRVPGQAVLCRDPLGLGFDRFAGELGYPTVRIQAGHDAMLTRPAELAALLAAAA